MHEEEWRDIPGYPGYQASSLGRIRSLDRLDTLPGGFARKRKGRILRGNKSHGKQGYLVYTPSVNSVVTTVSGHRLVMLAFAGPPKAGQIIRHYDGDGSNNSITNLRYGTHKENEADKERHGTKLLGESVSGAKLTETQVVEMRVLRASGVKLQELARLFSVGMDTISLVCIGRTWAQAGGPISQPDPRGSYPRLTRDENKIRQSLT